MKYDGFQHRLTEHFSMAYYADIDTTARQRPERPVQRPSRRAAGSITADQGQ